MSRFTALVQLGAMSCMSLAVGFWAGEPAAVFTLCATVMIDTWVKELRRVDK
jgi:hypothetical protein